MSAFSSLLALRYLRSKKSSTFLSLITTLSIAGIALGVAALIVTLSVMEGFEGVLKNRLAEGEFHILALSAADDPYFTFSPEEVSQVFAADSHIRAVNPVLTTEAILRSGKKVAGVSIRGITEGHSQAIASQLVEAVKGPKGLSPNGIWLGQELAFSLNLLPGDKVSLISPTETEGPLETVPRMRVFRVEGVYQTGIPEKDLHVIYVPVDSVREFLGLGQVVNQVEVRVDHFSNSVPAANAIRAELGSNFVVKDWEQLNAHLFSSLELERVMMFVILSMIIIVASFNVVTSLRMMVMEKRKEISILQAMGATRAQIGRIFLSMGILIGNFGSLVGLALGLLVCYLIQRYPIIRLPDVFYDRSIPVKISALFVLGVGVTAILIVMVAALFPARAAAKMHPLEGIREI